MIDIDAKVAKFKKLAVKSRNITSLSEIVLERGGFQHIYLKKEKENHVKK